MFELTTLPTETRVPALDGPHLALSSTVGSAPGTEIIVPLRPASLTILVSATGGTETPASVVEFFDKHFVEHERSLLERRPSAAGYVATALMLLQTGCSTEALELLEEGRVKFNDYWIEHFRGIALSENGRGKDAESALRALSKEHPSDWRPRHALGVVQIRADQWATAATTLKEAADLPDASPGVFNDLATALITLRDVPAAMKALRRALALDPRFTLGHNNLGVCYRMQGSGKSDSRALQCFLTALKCDARCTPAIHNLAECYIATASFDRVVELLEPHIQNYPADAHAIERLAWAHYQLGSVRRAAALLRDGAMRSAAGREALLNNLALICRARGEVKDAEAAFRLALASDSVEKAQLDVRLNYALMLRLMHRWAEIVEVLPERIALRHPGATALRATALTSCADPSAARDLLTKGLQVFPDNDELTIALGHILCSYLDTPEKAIQLLQAAGGDRKPSHPMIANNLAYALIKAGRLDSVREVLADHFVALRSERTPTAICVRATWGLLRIREGAFAEGMDLYRGALGDAAPEQAPRLRQKILVEEGRHLLRQGQRDVAIRKLRKAVGLHVDAEFGSEARELLRSAEPPN